MYVSINGKQSYSLITAKKMPILSVCFVVFLFLLFISENTLKNCAPSFYLTHLDVVNERCAQMAFTHTDKCNAWIVHVCVWMHVCCVCERILPSRWCLYCMRLANAHFTDITQKIKYPFEFIDGYRLYYPSHGFD